MKPAAMIVGLWSKRSGRERLLLMAAGLLVAACLILAGVQGLAHWRTAAAARLASATAEHRAVAAGLAQLKPDAGEKPSGSAAPAEQAARESAEGAGLDVTLEAVADGLEFRTEPASSVALFEWLTALESDDVRSVQLTMERTDEGLVVAQGLLVSQEKGPA